MQAVHHVNALEEKVRGLILNNSDKTSEDHGKNFDGQRDAAQEPEKTSRNTRKRLNQAQRREMSAQLAIPIDLLPPSQYQDHQHQPHHNMNSASQFHHQRPPGPPQFRHQQQSPPHAIFGPSPSSAAFSTGSHYSQHQAHHQPSPGHPQAGFSDWRQAPNLPNGFSRSQHGARGSHKTLFNPHTTQNRQYQTSPEDLSCQVALLQGLCSTVISNAEIENDQIEEKERFRRVIEYVCQQVVTQYETDSNGRAGFPPSSVQLRCFGSLASGFATKSSDMDLGLFSPFSHPQPESHESPIPRLIEKAFLEMGLGARLLTKTRVPIIKLCEKPPPKLYSDLVEERMKWEKGFVEDREAEDEETQIDHTPSPTDKVNCIVEPKLSRQTQSSGSTVSKDKPIYQDLLSRVKQNENMSLTSYYSLAKKILRKLEGFDINHSTAADFRAGSFQILNDVCRAFVRGLADQALRSRLESYASLAFDPSTQYLSNRSLLGVMTQIEGEKLVMAWESRKVRERDDHQEYMCENRIRHWKELQNKPTGDPLAYNKELHSALSLLNMVSSISLQLLKQRQHESASEYHSRTIKLMVDLGASDLVSGTSPRSPTLHVVLQQYIDGISINEIRASVADFVESVESPSLRAIARRHKSLQLAYEYEKAMEKGLYPSHCQDVVRSYVEVLRRPMIRGDPADVHFDFVVPMTPDSWELVDTIHDLPDPSRMSPNQPRDPYRDRLELPKSGVGVQCDINFSAHLGLQNTRLLKCYALTDPRVRPLVLFVKHWAKVRGINTPYRGTLSSYGYVLMVLHYLVNVAQPAVCPNLQCVAPPVDPNLSPEQIEDTVLCKGRNIHFWRNEQEIHRLAKEGALTQNRDSVGHLLRGFFEYYAHSNVMSTGQMRGFEWGRDVLSLRTHGGILSKKGKGWTGARTTIEVQSKAAPAPASEPAMLQANPKSPAQEHHNGHLACGPQPLQSPGAAALPKSTQEQAKTAEVKEVRHRFLFAIEDPFELDHNVARTVTHNGIVSIRDELRRAWRIIRNASKNSPQEDLLEEAAKDNKSEREAFMGLLEEIHGRKVV